MSWLPPFNRSFKPQDGEDSERTGSIREVTPDSIRAVSPLINEISEFWFANRSKGLVPDWNTFSPHTHTKFLPHIILWEVVEGSYLARVTGEKVVNMLPLKISNRRLDELENEALAFLTAELDQVVANNAPVYVDRRSAWELEDETVHCQAVHLPFRAESDETNRVLSVMSFTLELNIDFETR